MFSHLRFVEAARKLCYCSSCHYTHGVVHQLLGPHDMLPVCLDAEYIDTLFRVILTSHTYLQSVSGPISLSCRITPLYGPILVPLGITSVANTPNPAFLIVERFTLNCFGTGILVKRFDIQSVPRVSSNTLSDSCDVPSC